MQSLRLDELKKSYKTLLYLYSSESCDMDKINMTMLSLKVHKANLKKYSLQKPRVSRKRMDSYVDNRFKYYFLLYTLETLYELWEEKDQEKTVSFLTTVSDTPDVILENISVSSFKDKILVFREKYGEKYFKDFLDNDANCERRTGIFRYMLPVSNGRSRRNSPIVCPLICIFGALSFIAPIITFLAIASAHDIILNGWTVLCIFGCLIAGIGLFNLTVSLLTGRYLGHIFTLLFIAAGGLMTFVGIKLMGTDFFTDEQVAFYFISLLFLLFPLIVYPWFRSNIKGYLRIEKRLSRSTISKKTKGFKNFLWYEELHKTENLGMLYRLNKFFTFLYPITLTISLLFGFIRVISIPIFILSAITYITTTVMLICASVHNNISKFGKPIVILGTDSMRRTYSVFLDMILWVFPLLMLYAHAISLNAIWNII